MIRLMRTVWLVLLIKIFIEICHGKDDVDPCKTATQISYMTQRLIGYKMSKDEMPICDNFLKSGWYKMDGYILANTTEKCGTSYNWYMSGGKLPKDGTTNTFVNVCRYENPKRTCEDMKQVEVKKCDTFYAFNLGKIDGCDEAYCIRSIGVIKDTDKDAPDISSVNPVINVTLVAIDEYSKELNFQCNFDITESMGYYYIVEWSRTTGYSSTGQLRRSESIQYKRNENEDFLEKTKLTEDDLRQHGIENIGFTIACTVFAQKSLTGALSKGRVSPYEFYGIKVLNRAVTIDLLGTREITAQLQLTVPFHCPLERGHCALKLQMFIPQVKHCSISEVAKTSSFDDQNACGVDFKYTEIGTIKNFSITASVGNNLQKVYKSYGIMFRTMSYREHKIFGNYAPDPIRVTLQYDTTALSGKVCYAHSDPHMLTFDQQSYDNQNEGAFIMYRNKKYKTEVQIKTDKCDNYKTAWWKPWCNCGVAVRAGQDVYVMDKCNGKGAWDIHFRHCQDRVMQRSVKKDKTGSIYHISLPTGTEVQIKIGSKFAEVDINPSLLDKYEADGLCGNFDDTADDFDSNASKREKEILRFRVKHEDSLFHSDSYKYLQSWGTDIYLCTCRIGDTSGALKAAAYCDAKQVKTCEDDNFSNVQYASCSKRRKRRYVDHRTYMNGIDRHTSVATNFQYLKTKSKGKKMIFKRMAYSNQTAFEECSSMMNTSAFQMCSNLPDLKLDSYVQNCVGDALASQSMEWTKLHLEQLKKQCVRNVEVNQPIPAAVLSKVEEMKVFLNFTNFPNDTDDDNVTLLETSTKPLTTSKPKSSFVYTLNLLENIKSVSCPDDCSGHGKCNKGICSCDDGYINTDCSVNENDPPTMKGIPDRGTCDLRQRECAKTSVFGENFVSSEHLACRLKPLLVGVGGNIDRKSYMVQKATLQTFEEISCPLPHKRQRRSLASPVNDYIARGYEVSTTNNGIAFSEADFIAIFDSQCVSCSTANRSIVCTIKPGFCMADGLCYRPGDLSGCYICTLLSSTTLEWTAGPDCPVSNVPPEEENKKLWVIGATVGPVAALVIISTVAFCCISKKKTKEGRKIGSMTSMNKR